MEENSPIGEEYEEEQEKERVDTQVLEMLGRNILLAELFQAGLEVALPMRDRGVDLIAYAERSTPGATFVARPLQLKAASRRRFVLEAKYATIPDLLLVYVWYVDDFPNKPVSYALTYPEALHIADEQGYTKTASWGERGRYVVPSPSQTLLTLLEPYRMKPATWLLRITGTWPL